MADFDIEVTEGCRWVKIELDDDEVRTERGALYRMDGDIEMDMPLPSLRSVWVSLFSDESILRPRYVGTGDLYLDSTFGGYHIFDVRPDEKWILEHRCFWASEAQVKLGIHREPMWTSFWAGQGLLWYKTTLRGKGKGVLAVDGPVEAIELDGDRVVIDGDFVVARTAGIRMRMKRPAKSLISHLLSGEKLSCAYEGTGRLLICSVPYWRQRLQKSRGALDDALLDG
jgi:uncharacterized protein (AIM24 family)